METGIDTEHSRDGLPNGEPVSQALIKTAREFVLMAVSDPFALMNAIGLVAFALVGSSKAIREEFDLLGVTIVGLAMAFVGGMTRDLLVTRIPLALQSPIELTLGVFGVLLAIALNVVLQSPDEHPVTLVADALGLGAFATTGVIVATEAHISPFGVIAVGTINAVGGGAFADILLDRSPFILFDDFYASCAVLGGATYFVADVAGAAESTAAVGCALVTVTTRVVAVTRNWELPSVQELGLTENS